jgi:cytochrome c oxidase cbb3-type subunit 4
MDVNDLRIAVTLLSFACFAGVVAWALARRNRPAFDEAALIPFTVDEAAPQPADRRAA